MEVAKLLSALNVTNHINQGWDFDQYSTVVNSKAAVRQPPPIYPKTDSLLRENNKRFMPFRYLLINICYIQCVYVYHLIDRL